ncbi:unnamed protein product [Orchesella dallaii]|uniref:Cyclic nucleotide-binding domain-containing protein n=1 Tax=Orchesella dallaii TaxID=48710 RepID=A0ABP1QJ68_9HEXA
MQKRKGFSSWTPFFFLSSLLFLAFLISSTSIPSTSATSSVIDPDPNPNKAYEDDDEKEYNDFCYAQSVIRDMPEKIDKESCKKTREIDFHDDDMHVLFMIFIVILYGAVVRSIIRYFHSDIPYTVIVMASGMGMGLISKYFCYELYTYTAIARTHPKIILFTFLPILLFESSFSISGHVFMKAAGQVLLLAAPGMLFCTFLTAFVCFTFFTEYKWTFLESLFFGCIISATDPVAVVSILKELGVSETLGVLIDGESLLNDGVAILLYEVLKDLILAIELGHVHTTWELVGHITQEFFQIAVGGPVFGWVMAKIAIFCLCRIFNDAVVEITLTLVATYLTYYIGETVFHVSGVMAVVILGITMSSEKTCISPETEHEVHEFWGMLGHLANTVLFFITGVIIMERGTRNLDWNDLYYLILLYCSLNVVRFLMLLIMSPILTRIGYGMPWQNMIVMMWGGLRGAVGICLSLEVYEHIDFCQKKLGPKILLQTAGIVLLTLCVNGTTTKKLLEVLKLTEISPGRMEEMKNALRTINVAHKKALIMLRHDRFLSDANWTYVAEHTKIDDPYRNKIVADKSMPTQSSIVSIGPEHVLNECPACHTYVPNQPTNEELKLMTEEARLRVIKAMKISFWAHFERGVLTEEAVQILAGTAETISDRVLYMIHARDLKKYWTIRGIFPWLRECVLNHGGGRELEQGEVIPPKPKRLWKQRIWWLATRSWFENLMTFLVILNMIPAIVQLIVENNYPICDPGYIIYFYVLTAINQGFSFIYVLEFLIKIIGRGCSDYWNSKWNILDFIVLAFTLFDAVIVATVGCADSSVNSAPGALNFFKIFRIVRIFRGLKLLKNLIPAILRGINGRINTQLFLGYDVALGYICACDDVLKFLPHMIDNKRVLHKIRSSVEKERLEAVREMGILQKNHPGIAIAVKTRHASRSVLNHMKSTLNELRVDGLLDEKENDLLTVVLEERMKRLWNCPSYIAPPAPEVLLANLNWLYGHEELRDHIFKNATFLQFEVNDVIASVGDAPQGIYVIVSGMIRIDYEPSMEAVEDRAAYGVIPVMEIFKDFEFDRKTTDYCSSGMVIGESSCLTGRQRAASVICETEGVSAYHIPASVMQEALETFTDHFNSLEERLWRACGMRRAANYLTTLSSYHNMPKEKLEMLLERSCVPIGPDFDTIKIPPYVQEVVVIEGMVKNEETGEIYIAPAVIPKICTKITMPINPKTMNRVLVFLQEDQMPDEYDDDRLAQCLIAAKKQRRPSIPDEKLTEQEMPAESVSTSKQKQRRMSVAVNFGVRQKGRKSSEGTMMRRSSIYTAGSTGGSVQNTRVLRKNVRRKSTVDESLEDK